MESQKPFLEHSGAFAHPWMGSPSEGIGSKQGARGFESSKDEYA